MVTSTGRAMKQDKEMRVGERCYFGNSGLGRPYSYGVNLSRSVGKMRERATGI